MKSNILMVEKSNIIINNKFVNKDSWYTYIDNIKKNIDQLDLIKDETKAIDLIKKPFIDSVKERLPFKKFGIFFSGGVDSTLISYICKKFTDNFICYTVGIQGSQDIEISQVIAKKLRFNHVIKILTIEEMKILFSRTSKILKDNLNIVNLGVGAVEIAAIELAKKDKITTFFGGLGSEEIFAGYKRHENSNNINQECWIGLKSTYERDFIRDYLIAKNYGVKMLTPFLDKKMINSAMQIDDTLKIKDNIKKYILRKMAIDLGLEMEFAMRPKKAAQYGSSFDKAIRKITKSLGFRYKKEYLKFLSNNK